MNASRFRVMVEYDDPYVQPLILAALESSISEDAYDLIDTASLGASPANALNSQSISVFCHAFPKMTPRDLPCYGTCAARHCLTRDLDH